MIDSIQGSMKPPILIAAACVLSTSVLNGAVVGGTNILLRDVPPGGFPDSDYALTIFEDEGATDTTTIIFDVIGTTLQFVNTNIDGGSDWYLTRPGDLFTAENILADAFPTFFEIDGFVANDIDVGTSPFFLGANADDYTSFYNPRGTFGWAQFQIIGGQLTMLDNAVSYGRGIIVGTTEAIPEPGSLSLVALAALLVLRRRR